MRYGDRSTSTSIRTSWLGLWGLWCRLYRKASLCVPRLDGNGCGRRIYWRRARKLKIIKIKLNCKLYTIWIFACCKIWILSAYLSHLICLKRFETSIAWSAPDWQKGQRSDAESIAKFYLLVTINSLHCPKPHSSQLAPEDWYALRAETLREVQGSRVSQWTVWLALLFRPVDLLLCCTTMLTTTFIGPEVICVGESDPRIDLSSLFLHHPIELLASKFQRE